jgi:hypothetical protein
MKRAICLMTLVGAGLAVGCGGGSDSTPTSITPTVKTPSKLSKADFISQADAYCAEVNAALGSISSSSSTSSSAAAGQRADLFSGLMQHLRGLGTPDDQTGLDEFLSAGDAVASAEKSEVDAATSGDTAALTSAESDAASAQSSFASAASAYGFKECGQGPSTPSGVATAPSTAPPVAPTAPAAPTATTPAPVPAAPAGGTAGTPAAPTGGAGGGAAGGGSTGGTSGSGGVGPG